MVCTVCVSSIPDGRPRWQNSHFPWWTAGWHAPCHRHSGAPLQCYTNWNRWAFDLTACCCWSDSSQARPLAHLYPRLTPSLFPSPGCYCLQWQSGQQRDIVKPKCTFLTIKYILTHLNPDLDFLEPGKGQMILTWMILGMTSVPFLVLCAAAALLTYFFSRKKVTNQLMKATRGARYWSLVQKMLSLFLVTGTYRGFGRWWGRSGGAIRGIVGGETRGRKC